MIREIYTKDMKDTSRLAELLTAVNGDIKELRRIVPRYNVDELNEALVSAARSGRTEAVVLLIPVAEPMYRNSLALRNAAQEGHVEVVRALIPVSDATELQSRALRSAARNGHGSTVSELIPVSDVTSLFMQELKRVLSNQTVESFRFIDMLAAHVDDSVRLQALSVLPSQWLTKVPYLVSWNRSYHQDREFEQAVPAGAAKPGGRTRLGRKEDR